MTRPQDLLDTPDSRISFTQGMIRPQDLLHTMTPPQDLLHTRDDLVHTRDDTRDDKATPGSRSHKCVVGRRAGRQEGGRQDVRMKG